MCMCVCVCVCVVCACVRLSDAVQILCVASSLCVCVCSRIVSARVWVRRQEVALTMPNILSLCPHPHAALHCQYLLCSVRKSTNFHPSVCTTNRPLHTTQCLCQGPCRVDAGLAGVPQVPTAVVCEMGSRARRNATTMGTTKRASTLVGRCGSTCGRS